jgi:hypothetical protein
MKNLFVPPDIANTLKNMGFNEPCICGYDIQGRLRSKLSHSDAQGSRIDWDTHDIHIPAPLWQQVTAWLRDTKKINVFVSFRPNVKKWDAYYYDMNMNGRDYVKQFTLIKFLNREVFDTYEEALESAIVDYLNNTNNNGEII